MPTWVTAGGASGGCGGAGSEVVVLTWVPSGTGTTTIASPITTSSTGDIIWINCTNTATTSTMSHSAFFTSDASYTRQIALQQQAMQMMLAQTATSSSLNNSYTNIALPARQLTAEEIAERDRRRDAELAEHERLRRERLAARARAKELLLEHLTEEQRATFEKNGWFVVEGGRSKRKYKIHTNRVAGNVERLHDDGRGDELLCGHYRGPMRIPDYDEFLAQKLMIEGDEDAYRSLANRSAMR